MGKPRHPATHPLTLERWPEERHMTHRAMLLWAMQATSLRSYRATARAMGRSDGTIRGWCEKGSWKARLASHKDGDQVALDLYRREYMADFGPVEIPHVAANVIRPLGSLHTDDPVEVASQLTRDRVAKTMGTTTREVEQAVVPRVLMEQVLAVVVVLLDLLHRMVIQVVLVQLVVKVPMVLVD